MAATAFTSCQDSTHLQHPSLKLRVGIDVCREGDLHDAVSASADDRQKVVFPTVALSRQRASLMHLILQGPRAGAPFSRLVSVASFEPSGHFRLRPDKT